MASIFLSFTAIPLGGVIWGWAIVFLKDKTDICLGVFFAIVLPALLLLALKAPERILDDLEASPRHVYSATLLVMLIAVCTFSLLSFAWKRTASDMLPRAMQKFVDFSSLGHSSRGVRLITVSALAQVLVLAVGWYFYSH